MSDSNMQGLTGLVIGTAGHIDHGKTSLVYALTGIDTDRLKEEKQRGISIDLGFAEMQLPDGLTISFVDVPGHERFVRNMLAGAVGMEAVLLIVAANESVKPQTREHFEICRLLGLQHGIIVLTKCDLSTREQIEITRSEVQSMVVDSFLAHAPVIEVSSVTKAGLPELKLLLASVAARQSSRDRAGVARMPVDRCFAVKGFGTVVTGTLLAGVVSAGESLELFPQKLAVRVRGLQAQHASVKQVSAGQRVAVNLAGIEQHAIKRGHLLASADALAGSRVMDVELRWLADETPPGLRELLVLHIGTAEVSTRVALFRNSSQQSGFARLRLAEEAIAIPGDRFVLRRPSPSQTVGGGVIIDAFPPRRLNRSKTIARLTALRDASLSGRIEILTSEALQGLNMRAQRGRLRAAKEERNTPSPAAERSLPRPYCACSLQELVRMTGASRAQITSAIAQSDTVLITADERLVTRGWVEEKRQTVLLWLRDFHKAHPNAAGASLITARQGMEAGLAALVFKDFPGIRIQGDSIALATHKAQFSAQDAAALQTMEHAFRAAGYQPPSVAEAIAASGVDAKKAKALLDSLVKSNRLVKLPDDLIFHSEVLAHIRNSLAQQKGRRFSVVDFKSWTNVSRKFAIPLLEYLDQQRVTKRDGEVRIVL